jgi:hypothetical protein
VAGRPGLPVAQLRGVTLPLHGNLLSTGPTRSARRSRSRITYAFRGTSSTEPDNDIVSWLLDFGDGTSASGSWITNPPTDISHEYLIHYCATCTRDPATLTVTDSAGQSDTDQQFAFHQYPD